MTRLLGLAMMLMFAVYGASFLGLFDLPYPQQILSQVGTSIDQSQPQGSGSFTNRVSRHQRTKEAVQSTADSFTNRISKQGQKLSQIDGAAVLRQNMLVSGQQKLFFERG